MAFGLTAAAIAAWSTAFTIVETVGGACSAIYLLKKNR